MPAGALNDARAGRSMLCLQQEAPQRYATGFGCYDTFLQLPRHGRNGRKVAGLCSCSPTSRITVLFYIMLFIEADLSRGGPSDLARVEDSRSNLPCWKARYRTRSQ